MTTTEQRESLAIAPDQDFWSEAQLAALRNMDADGFRDATKSDFATFFHMVKRTGLDPFARQIYMQGRRSKDRSGEWTTRYQVQTNIDGMRLTARRAVDRTGGTLGYSETLWCGPDGKWRDVWLANTPPAAAKLTVYRDGQPYPAVAKFSEYAQLDRQGNPTRFWQQMSALMLSKVAEALALRRAFPQDLSGIYTGDEMAQADNPEPDKPAQPARQQTRRLRPVTGEASPPPAPSTRPEREEVTEAVAATGVSPDEGAIIVEEVLDLLQAVEETDPSDRETLRQLWRLASDMDGTDAVHDAITAKIAAAEAASNE